MKNLYSFIACLVFAFGAGVLVALEAVESHAELRVRAAKRAATQLVASECPAAVATLELPK